MHPNRHRPRGAEPAPCIWCNVGLGKRTNPRTSPISFCSRRCEIEANFWLFQELCEIEITHPPGWQEDTHNS
jgi:hypothetical protein